MSCMILSNPCWAHSVCSFLLNKMGALLRWYWDWLNGVEKWRSGEVKWLQMSMVLMLCTKMLCTKY